MQYTSIDAFGQNIKCFKCSVLNYSAVGSDSNECMNLNSVALDKEYHMVKNTHAQLMLLISPSREI